MEGVVKLFVKQQGWGVIDGGEPVGDVLVLSSAVESEAPNLRVGTRVVFEAEPDPDGPTGVRAARVRPKGD